MFLKKKKKITANAPKPHNEQNTNIHKQRQDLAQHFCKANSFSSPWSQVQGLDPSAGVIVLEVSRRGMACDQGHSMGLEVKPGPEPKSQSL